MALQRGSQGEGNSNEEMMQGMSDEQQREMKREIIVMQLRRYLRFFWIGVGLIIIIQSIFKGGGLLDAFGLAILLGGIGYGLTVLLFIHIMASYAIKIFLYFKSLFGGAARL